MKKRTYPNHKRCDDCKNMTTALNQTDGKNRCNRCHYNYMTCKLMQMWLIREKRTA